MSKIKKEIANVLSTLLDDYEKKGKDPLEMIRVLKIVPDLIMDQYEQNLNALLESAKARIIDGLHPDSTTPMTVVKKNRLRTHFNMQFIEELMQSLPQFRNYAVAYIHDPNHCKDELMPIEIFYMKIGVCNKFKDIYQGIKFMNHMYNVHPDGKCATCTDTDCPLKGTDINDKLSGVEVHEVDSLEEVLNLIFGSTEK